MKRFIFLAALLTLVAATTQVAQAQIGPGRLHVFATDTTSSSETTNYLFPKNLEGKYLYTWQVTGTRQSGTTTITMTLQETLGEGLGWYDVDTLTLSGGSGYVANLTSTGTNNGRQQRLRSVVGAGITELKIAVWYRKEGN